MVQSDNDAPSVQVLPHDAASWERCFRQLAIAGMLKQLAGNLELKQCDGNKLYFSLAAVQRHFLNDERQRQLQQALAEWSSNELSLDIELVEPEPANSPLQRQKQRLKQRLEAAQQALENDSLLQDFISTFDANIIPGSVESAEND